MRDVDWLSHDDIDLIGIVSERLDAAMPDTDQGDSWRCSAHSARS
jgi:hypothetical protein